MRRLPPTDTQNNDVKPDKTEGETEKKPGLDFRGLGPVYQSVFLDTMGISVMIPILPYYSIRFGAGAFELGLLFAVMSVASIPGPIIAGRLSDIYGRKPLIVSSIAGTCASFVFQAFVWNLGALFVARVIAGLFANSMPIAQAAIADRIPIKERPKFLGIVGACIGIAFTFGPGVGALVFFILKQFMTVEGAQRGVFIFCAIISATSCISAATRMPETLKSLQPDGAEDSAEVDVEMAEKSTEKRDEEDKNSTTETTSVAQSDADKKAADKKRESLSTLAIWVCLLVGFITNACFTVMQSLYSLVLLEQFNWSSTELGAILVASGLTIAVCQGALINPLVKKAGKHGVGMIGCVLLGGGMVGYTLILEATSLPMTVIKVIHLFFFMIHVMGFSLGNTSVPSLISRYTDETSQGKMMGLNAASASAARIVAPLTAGALYDYVSWQAHFTSMLRLPS